ncbi:MAG: sodium:calcium antiporter [Candidatus Bathyarchaeota archaeon]|nr:MAG: sodium:calcium antiporter [Candidatus Bathyarchaeota archaeon]
MAVLSYVSQYVIRSVEDFMELTGFSETSVGFALLSVITSTPELMVAIFAVSGGAAELSIGDLLGSNVFNLGIVVGVLMVTAGFLRECPEGLIEIADILLLSSIIPLVLVVLTVDTYLIGIGLLGIFALSIYRETRNKKPKLKPTSMKSNKGEEKPLNKPITALKILFGTIIIIISARFAVSSAIDIAGAFGLPQIFIGAKLLAIGTSLPELSLSLSAAKRGRFHLATANAIGSNLSNLTLILGVVFLSSLFSPFSINISSFIEIITFVLITSLVMWYHLTKRTNCRSIGIILILTYIAFQAIVIY